MKKIIKIEGFWDVTPKIKKISFSIRGKISIYLEDSRNIIIPISKLPSIKKLEPKDRKKWYLFGNGFSFDNCDQVFHVEQILGNFDNYRHENIK